MIQRVARPALLDALDRALCFVHDDARAFASHVARGGIGEAPIARTDDRLLRRLASLASDAGLLALYGPRIDELALEIGIMRSEGETRRACSIARWGTPDDLVDWEGETLTLRAIAERWVAEGHAEDGGSIEGEVRIEPECAAAALGRVALAAGLVCEVKLSDALVADAAIGDRTVYLARRSFSPAEVRRLAAHEVLGHLVAAENARHQPLALLRVGAAGSWEDQEGVALVLEERAGVLDPRRKLGIAARVLAIAAMLDGAGREDGLRLLMRTHGIDRELARRATVRAHRAGGSLRDLSYLRGLARVRRALARREVGLHALRTGKISVELARRLPALVDAGLSAPALHRPSLARSLRATFSGTSFDTSPPSRAASLTRLDAT